MAVNKGSSFSVTPLNPTKLDSTITAFTGIADNAYSISSTGTVGSSTFNNLTSDTLKKYEDRIAALSSANLDLTNEVLKLKKKLLEGTTPLIDAEARLLHLREALMAVTTTEVAGAVLVPNSNWEVVLAAIAVSMHDNVALDKLLKATVAKTVKSVASEVKAVKIKKAKFHSINDAYEGCQYLPNIEDEDDVPF